MIRNRAPLISFSFEKISSELFTNYSKVITERIGRSAGIYALFQNEKLYYVGRAVNLKRRVEQHLKDKHQKKWTHFSLFLINTEEHIGELESLLIRIADPKGNSVKPKGRDTRGKKTLEKLVKEKQNEERKKIFSNIRKNRTAPGKSGKGAKRIGNKGRQSGLVNKRVSLFRIYKGKSYRAVLTPKGIIIFNGKEYDSPTSAAKVITKRKAINGWYFWRIKDKRGNLIQLRHYK